MNVIPCGQCKFYDQIVSTHGKKTKRGWCAQRSMYPAHEGPGQVFPDGVRRAEEGELAQPFVVKGTKVLPGCPYAKPGTVTTPVATGVKRRRRI